MNKQRFNYFIDFCLFAVLGVNIFSAIFRIREIHALTGWIFLVFLGVHLLFHWQGIAIMIKRLFSNKKEEQLKSSINS